MSRALNVLSPFPTCGSARHHLPATGWSGPFYPPELKPKEYLTIYATKFNTVEVDSDILCNALGINREWLARQDA